MDGAGVLAVAARGGRRSWQRACTVAGVLYVVDALVLGQGLIAALLLCVACFWWLPLSLLLRRLARPAGRAAWRGALCFVTATAIMFTLEANDALARRRAADVIDAVELYRATHGGYPASLDALVPTWLAAVPRAKFTLAFAEFTYVAANGGGELGYFRVPPYRRAVYDFALRRWRGTE